MNSIFSEEEKKYFSSYVQIDEKRCMGCTHGVRACPTQAIRVRNGKHLYIHDRCIGCGECIRVCPIGAVRALTAEPETIRQDKFPVAMVSPVLYSQFPGVAPKDILQGLRQMGFRHAVDMAYFLEMFQRAADEFIIRNRETKQAPLPLISPVCPVVVRLIAFQFPSLIPHILPVMRPVALMSREVHQRIIEKYGVNREGVRLYYINPCPTKMSSESAFHHEGPYVDRALGINDIYAELLHQIENNQNAGITSVSDFFDYGVTKSSLIWGKSGGEIAGMNTHRTLAISGLRETIKYLEKIEIGLFQNIEYIEFRTCPEGCLGGTLTAIDKYIAKNAVQKMILEGGLKPRLFKEDILSDYEAGRFQAKSSLAKLARLFGAKKEPLSIEALQEIDNILDQIQGMDCAACGSPTCRAFAEDVFRGRALLSDCLVFQARKGRNHEDEEE